MLDDPHYFQVDSVIYQEIYNDLPLPSIWCQHKTRRRLVHTPYPVLHILDGLLITLDSSHGFNGRDLHMAYCFFKQLVSYVN